MKNVKTVAWSDLDISRQSIMGLFDGKYVRATTPFRETIFLAFGHDRHNSKVVFILQPTGQSWFRICDTDINAKEIATNVAYALMNYPSYEVMNKFLFTKVE